MRRRLYLPEEVKADIREHLEKCLAHAQSGFTASQEDEDTVTGELGGALRSGVRRVFVAQSQTEIPGEWKWSITYYKFRGRGPKATESYLGADGIFELNVLNGSRHDQKSLLFQAKLSGAGGRPLMEQAVTLTTWREAAFVVSYSNGGYRAVALDEVIAARGQVSDQSGVALAAYLGGDFVNCEVGDNELRYDGSQRQLKWRAMNGQVIAVSFQPKHRVAIRVEAPRSGANSHSADRVITPKEIHEFRMQATEQEVLSLKGPAEGSAVKSAQKRLALAYHPDRLGELDLLHQTILKRRLQEVNAAAARLNRK